MFWPFKKKKMIAPDMTTEDKEVIWAFAMGDSKLREKAIKIHRKYLMTLGARGTVEQRFMSEIDNPCPDFILRSTYRKEIEKQIAIKKAFVEILAVPDDKE